MKNGQKYENVYKNSNDEVRAKLDQNKISGIDILTGVVAHHEFTVSNMDENETMELIELLKSNQYVTKYDLTRQSCSASSCSRAHMSKQLTLVLINSLNLTLNAYA